ncbi:hypothetical protein ACH4VM_15690 [Streptomyces sp. NPDC020792]|uniref:hypothetical protein n=1 Tax=Streptomyces sp. NPDC020792 TaxID=3365089 RepID=UPI00378FA98C
MAGPIVRWGAALGLGAVWWWAVLRLLLSGEAGVLEGAVAAGGWGLSLLPVHCVPKEARREGPTQVPDVGPDVGPEARGDKGFEEPALAEDGGAPFPASGGWPYGVFGGPPSADGGWPFGAATASSPHRADEESGT